MELERLFLKRSDRPLIVPFDLPTSRDDEERTLRIRCPHCQWQPAPSSRWCCLDQPGHPEYFTAGCGTSWNTFHSRGRCPGCSYRWRWTICLSCTRWSLHDDWYDLS